MSDLLHNTVWPISYDVRPRQRRRIFTVDDIDPQLLARYPNLVDEANGCPIYVWREHGRPERDWDGGEDDRLPLDVAVNLPSGGET